LEERFDRLEKDIEALNKMLHLILDGCFGGNRANVT